MELCMSHSSSIRYLDLFGAHHDKKVLTWLDEDQNLLKLAGDNIDINQSVRDQRKGNPGKSHHWFLTMAFKNPVPSSHLPNDKPICSDITNMPLTEFLLNHEEQQKLKEDFCILILRVLCHHLEFMKPFEKYVKRHIPHQFSASFQKKGECINLGLVFENENTTEGMVHILESLHKYVKDFDERVVFGGDQLTEERAAGVQRLRQNGATPQARLAGLLPTAESWHAKMALLFVSASVINYLIFLKEVVFWNFIVRT